MISPALQYLRQQDKVSQETFLAVILSFALPINFPVLQLCFFVLLLPGDRQAESFQAE